jgi:hypothetical protein
MISVHCLCRIDRRWHGRDSSDKEQAKDKPQSHLHKRAFCICVHRISDHCLDSLLHPFLAAAILVTNVKDYVIRVSLKGYNCDDLRCFWILSENDLVTPTQKPFAF